MNTSDLIAERDALKAKNQIFNVVTDNYLKRLGRIAEIDAQLTRRPEGAYNDIRDGPHIESSEPTERHHGPYRASEGHIWRKYTSKDVKRAKEANSHGKGNLHSAGEQRLSDSRPEAQKEA